MHRLVFLSASCCLIACLCADLIRVPDGFTQRAKHSKEPCQWLHGLCSQAPFEGSHAPNRHSKGNHLDALRSATMLVHTHNQQLGPAPADSAHITPAGTMLAGMSNMLTVHNHTPNRQQARCCKILQGCPASHPGHLPLANELMHPAGTRLPGRMLPDTHMPPRAATWGLRTCARSRSLWRSRSSCLSFSLSASATWGRQGWLMR